MKRLFLIIYTLILFFFFNQPLLSQGIKTTKELKKLNQKYYQIRKLMSEKKYDIAYIKYKDFIVQNYDFSEVYLFFSRCAKKIDKLNSTILFFKQLLKKEPKNTYFYFGLGVCYEIQKNYERAANNYENAINLQAKFLAVYYRRGYVCRNKDIPDLINYFIRRIKTNPDNSNLYYALGLIYQYRSKKFDRALHSFNDAIKIARKVGDRCLEGKHLNTLGNCYWGMSNYETALEYYKKAARVMFQIGDKTEEAKYLGNCGLINWNFGNFKLAMEYYQKALVISREIGDITGEASNLRNIGYVHSRLNQYSKALSCYNQALKIAQSYSNKPSKVGYLADISNIYWMKGDYQSALEYNKKALRIFLDVDNKNAVRNRFNESKALRGIGNIYWKIGDYARALEYYIRALKVSRKRVNKEKEAQISVDIGNIYNNIGDYSKALEYLQKALEIQREIKVKSAEGVTLGNMGRVYLNQKKFTLSIKYFQQALKIAQDIGDKRSEGNRLVGIASVLLSLGDYQKALKLLNQSLKLAKETDNKDIEASIFCKKGYLFNRIKNISESLKCYSNALSLGKKLKSADIIWESYSGLGSINEKQGKYKDALTCYKKSIEVIEKMRLQLQITEFKSGFLESKIKVYESAVNLLVKLHNKQSGEGYDKVSLYIVERAKARAFLDSLRESKTSISKNLSSELREAEHRIVKKISNIQTELMKPGLGDSARKAFIKKLEIEEENYRHLILKIKSDNPEYANLIYPEPCKLEEIQEKLMDKETALIEYFIGDKNAFVFFITKNDLHIHELPQSKELQERVNDYIKLISAKGVKKFDSFAAGHKLYQLLIGPFKNKLTSVKKLIVVPDRNLHYLPFETLISQSLSSNTKFMVEDYKISYAPSASSLIHLLERRGISRKQKDLLAFADPVYTSGGKPGKEIDADKILREVYLEQGFDFYPLKYSAVEVKKISRFIKGKFRDIYTREAAKEEKVKESSMADYKIVHFATHGLLDEKVPMRSSLVLSLDQDPKEDGFYQVREIYNTRLNSDLVILSACQTGKGRLEKGEGVSGLSRAFLYAGAQSVLVSLWNINDKATSEFMGYFYQYLSQRKSKQKALQMAKIKMVKSKYAHPFYWGSFILIGDYLSSVKLTKPGFWEKIF